MTLLVTSCAQTGTATKLKQAIDQQPIVIDTACDWVKPIYISNADVLSDGTARQILALNQTWQKNCNKVKR